MHHEAIWSAAKPVLSKLTGFKYLDRFYLAGGTALALQLAHRVSVDLDWFSQLELPKNLLEELEKYFAGAQVIPETASPEELTVMIDGVKTTFFAYPFPLSESLLEDSGFKLASVREIALMKARTIGRRAAFRDYVDLYFILRAGQLTLPELLTKAKKHFGDEFNQRLFLEQLVYLKDIEEQGVEFLAEKVSKEQIEDYFEALVKRITLK